MNDRYFVGEDELEKIELFWEAPVRTLDDADDILIDARAQISELIAMLRQANSSISIEDETIGKLQRAILESNEAVCRAIEERFEAFRNLPGTRLDG